MRLRLTLSTVAILVLTVIGFSFRPCRPRTLPSADSAVVTVFAAASLTDVIREAGKRFETKHGVKVILSFDSTSNLVRQIKAGAPADVFISADEEWMNDLAAAGAILNQTRRDLLGNELVMIAPSDKPLVVQPIRDFDIRESLPEVKRFAVADPAHVPAGRYARQALESLGWWTTLQPLLAPTQDVRAALRLVEIGEADAGIVYSTDARQSSKVAVIAVFPSGLHAPIVYPVAACRDSVVARKFIEFLTSPEISDVFRNAGFRVLNRSKFDDL